MMYSGKVSLNTNKDYLDPAMQTSDIKSSYLDCQTMRFFVVMISYLVMQQ